MSEFNAVKNNLMLMRDFYVEEENLQGICDDAIQYIESLESKVRELEDALEQEANAIERTKNKIKYRKRIAKPGLRQRANRLLHPSG